MEILVLHMKNTELRADVYIKQIKKNTYRVTSKIFNKLNFVKDIERNDLKNEIIDFIVNGYIIVHNLLTDITDEIFDFIENYKPIDENEKIINIENVDESDVENQLINKIEF